ncbi:MAG: molybdopterin cofactor-binding domain-containing protein [Pseudomonadota bacterium]
MSEATRRAGEIELHVNGRRVSARVSALTRLVDFLRDDQGLTGTHVGCDTAQCGACVVRLNGVSVKACTVLAAQADGGAVETIESVATNGELHPLQRALSERHGLQCGFCTPGLVMSILDATADKAHLSRPQIRAALKGNLCRCTGYQHIVDAVEAYLHSPSDRPAPDAPEDSRIGDAPLRREDARFLTGNGRYTADVSFPGQTYVAFARSEVSHGRINLIDASKAGAAPGVIGVLTGEDLEADGIGALRCGWKVANEDGSAMADTARPVLARGKVRFHGEAIAAVIAETPDAARHAAGLIRADFTPLAPHLGGGDSPADEALHQGAPDNVCFRWAIGDEAAAARAMDDAEHVVSLDLRNNRLVPNALEPRAANARYDPSEDRATLYVTSQNPHMARRVIADIVGLRSENRLRVISPDVGGGFGSKIFVYPEECVCVWAARKFGRPVKWVASRRESFLADAHGRDHQTTAQMGFDADGRITALTVRTRANLGAYLSGFATFVPSFIYGTMLAGPYKTPIIRCAVTGAYTTTAPVDAYRGAGRPEATYVIETLLDEGARALSLDPAELRRRNLIRKEDFPYQTPVAVEYDDGDYEAHLTAALEQSEYASFAERREASQRNGKRRGIGVACFVEAAGIGPSALAGAAGGDVGLWESASLRFSPTGALDVLTGSHSHGQGHETSFAQIVHDRLGVPFNDIRIIHGDTDKTPTGMGTYGSRSISVGGGAIAKAADKIIDKAKIIAAYLLDIEPEDITFEEGRFFKAGANAGLMLQDIAEAAYRAHDLPPELEPGLEATAFYDPDNFTFPSGTHVCEVEIDPETGAVAIERYTAVDDFGEIVHPMIVAGQVHGGVAQGVGQALFEEARYDEATGALMTDSLRAYRLPRAADIPDIDVASSPTQCGHNPLGVKGCGEAGAIAAPAAVMNGIADAIGRRIDMPATPAKIWRALKECDDA